MKKYFIDCNHRIQEIKISENKTDYELDDAIFYPNLEAIKEYLLSDLENRINRSMKRLKKNRKASIKAKEELKSVTLNLKIQKRVYREYKSLTPEEMLTHFE